VDMVILAQVLNDAGLAKMEGRDRSVFIYQMPEDVRRGVLLRQPDGGDPIDFYMPGYYKTGFQVVVRYDDYQLGMKLALDVSEAFTIRQPLVLSGTRLQQVLPENKPFVFPISEGGLMEYSVHFSVVYSE
tara:strand:- start:499 stop:888 length:390 start_codon:yes stop_codon:yes gene_type:complete